MAALTLRDLSTKAKARLIIFRTYWKLGLVNFGLNSTRPTKLAAPKDLVKFKGNWKFLIFPLSVFRLGQENPVQDGKPTS